MRPSATITNLPQPSKVHFGAVMDASPSDQLIYGDAAWHTMVVLVSTGFSFRNMMGGICQAATMRDFQLKRWCEYGSDKTRCVAVRAFASVLTSSNCIAYAHSATEGAIKLNTWDYCKRLGITGNWTEVEGPCGERYITLRHISSDQGPVAIPSIAFRQVPMLLWMANTLLTIRENILAGAKHMDRAAGPWAIVTDQIALDHKANPIRMTFIRACLAAQGGLHSLRFDSGPNPTVDVLADNLAGMLQAVINQRTTIVTQEAERWMHAPGCPIHWACPEKHGARLLGLAP
jgi:hypothetical protein